MISFHPLHPLWRLAAIIVLCLAPLAALANEEGEKELQLVDSLLTRYESASRQERLRTTQQLIDLYATSNAFLEDKPTLRADMPDDSLDLTLYYATERFYLINAYYTEALEYNDRAAKSGSERHPNIHATLLCDRGYCYHKMGRTSEAAQVEHEAMRYCQQTGNLLQLSRAYLYLAIVNHGINDQEQAKSFILKAIETNKQLGVNQQTHNALGVASEIFCGAGEVEKGIDYGRQAVEAAEAIGFEAGVANHLSQLSYAYDRNKQYELGIEAADRAIAIINAMDIPDRNILAVASKFKGWNLLDMGRNAEAAEALWAAVAIEREIGNTMGECYDMKAIAEALEPIDPRGAMRALRRYSSMADSIHTSQLQEALGQANANFRNDELQEENAANRRTNRIILAGSIVIIALLLLTALALWWASRQKSRSNRALRNLQEAREHFFTNVTHEFRTPLTVILGVSQELKDSTPPSAHEQAREAGAIIERQGQQLLTLVNQLLDISKVKSAIGSQPQRTDDVATYASMIVESMRELAREKEVSLTFEAAPTAIIADFVPDYMQKILSNLLSNALKFTPAGGSVRVSMEEHKNQLDLRVSDTGEGIAPEHLPHIFEPFYQADTSHANGTGIGLALVRQIVDALQGKITVASTVGEGTTFDISLPIRRSKDQTPLTDDDKAFASAPVQTPDMTAPLSIANEDNEAVIHQQQQASATPGINEANTLILIVEDNRDVAEYIGRQLGSEYRLAFAADGDEGIAKARELMPDLIITDLMMPHTDGLALCRTIRTDDLTNHIPIIVITAKATEADRLKGLAAGADAYLYKPFNSEELHIRITRLLQQRKILQLKYAQSPVLPDVEATDDTATKSLREQAEETFLEKTRAAIRNLMTSRQTDVDHVASELCMSPSQLRRKLDAITGVTPGQFILSTRMDEAGRMLREHPDWQVAEVAEQCGFADQPHFTRVFRNYFGITPGQYQRQE